MADLITTHSTLARVGIDKHYPVFSKMRRKVYPKIGWRDMTSELKSQQYLRIEDEGGFNYATVVNEADAIPTTSFNTGNSKDYYWAKRGLGYRASFEKLETDQYGIVQKVARKMAIAMEKTKESTAWNIFNNHTSTSTPYVGRDGVALVSASHPYDGGTWSNRGTGTSNGDVDLAIDTLEDAMAKMRDTVDEKGIPDEKMGPFKLIVPNELWAVGQRLAKALKLPEGMNNDPNVAGALITEVVVSPWLTDPDAWFLVEADSNEHGLFTMTHGSRRVQKKLYEETEEYAFFLTEKWLFHHADARGVWGTTGA